MKEHARKIYWVLRTQLGIDPRRLLRSLGGVPRYLGGWWRFRQGYDGKLAWLPCLNDWHEEGGATRDEYFWQDLHVARLVFAARPQRHVDIGSRVDGFVAHVAAFRAIEVVDIRPITATIPGVVFRQADLMNAPADLRGCCDSLSCLHALEHFGLGRYGDPINPQGHRDGLANLASMLRPGGVLYLSVPIGQERVEFNAHRVFGPRALATLAGQIGLNLQGFSWMVPGQTLMTSTRFEEDLQQLDSCRYALGIFTFVRT